MTRGNFEVYNLQIKSFALDNGGYDLLLVPRKDSRTIRSSNEMKYENVQKNQFQIVANRLKSEFFRKINFSFKTRLVKYKSNV